MLTGELKSQVDTLWNSFWTGGIANPLKVVEQITYSGAMSKDRLYEAPFTDIPVAGPDSVFTSAKVI
jgi:hypothetical protein